MIDDIFREKIKKNISFKCVLNQDELLFYSGNRFKALFDSRINQDNEEP